MLRAGIPHAHACGGNVRCSTCRVVVLEGLEHCAPRNAREVALAERLHLGPTIRLACQTVVRGDVKLRRPVLDDVDVELTSQIRAGATPDRVGEEKQIAILFSDISDYIGDGIMALFGIEDSDGAAFRAVKAGLEMFKAVDSLNPYLEMMYGSSLQIRIGVHFGEVVVGTIGIANMKKVAAIGDAVNLASRIEAANKDVGTKFLISEEAYIQVSDQVQVNRCVQTTLRGKSGEYTLHEVIGMVEER